MHRSDGLVVHIKKTLSFFTPPPLFSLSLSLSHIEGEIKKHHTEQKSCHSLGIGFVKILAI